MNRTPLGTRCATALGLIAIAAACSTEEPKEKPLDPPESQPRYDGFVGARSHGIAVAQVNLDQLTRSAANIFHGNVVSKVEETLAVGGANAKVVRYHFAVNSMFKGAASEEFEMLVIKSPLNSLGKPLLEGLPEFSVGGDYVVFAGSPSKLGLSAPIGLTQGIFHVRGTGAGRHLVNSENNRGLYRGIDESKRQGPVTFDVLTSRVTALLKSKESDRG